MSKASRRYYRTVLLGLAAMGVLIWAAIDQFELSPQEMTELFLGTLWVMGGTIVFAAVCATLWIGLRRLLRSRDKP
jgi:hypothetical protein